MRPECTQILPTGQKCRCLALRGRNACRHHLAGPLPPREHRPNPFSRVSRWRNLGLTVHTLPAHDIPYHAFVLLGALLADGDDSISDREAGRLLRVLLRRHGTIPFPPPRDVQIDPEPEPAASSGLQNLSQMFSPELLDQMLAQNPNNSLLREILKR
ncbi:MAG: hypothetical protein WBD98_16100 [Acidobacteriaceae bacterium]